MTEDHTDITPPRDEGGPIAEAGWLGRVIDRVGIVFALGIIIAMLILIQEVVLRYFFNSPTIWAHETTVFLSGVAFVFGGLYCTARDSHIRVVLIYDQLGPKLRRAFDVVISVICGLAAAMFTWAAWIMVSRAAFTPQGDFRLERSGSAWDPVYPGAIKVFLMLILGIMTVQFVILAFNYARGRR